MELEAAKKFDGRPINVYIKCTYLELFKAGGEKLFSLQKDGFGWNIVGTVDNSYRNDAKGYIRITLSPDVRQILSTYTKRYLKKSSVIKPGATSLMDAPVVDKCYVKQSACFFMPADTNVTSTVTKDDSGDIVVVDNVTAATPKRTKLALIAAAAIALLGN